MRFFAFMVVSVAIGIIVDMQFADVVFYWATNFLPSFTQLGILANSLIVVGIAAIIMRLLYWFFDR